MKDFLGQHWDMLVGRWDGPLAFRFLLQPTMAALLGVRAGLRDARAGRPAYAWLIVSQRGDRRGLLLEGWRDVAKLFTVAVIVDLVYEIIVYRWLYPGQALVVASVLAIPTYLIVRGPANRIARAVLARGAAVDGERPR